MKDICIYSNSMSEQACQACQACQAYIYLLEAELERRDTYIHNSGLVYVDSMRTWFTNLLKEDAQSTIDKYMEPKIIDETYARFPHSSFLNSNIYRNKVMMAFYLSKIRKSHELCESKKYKLMLADYKKYVERARREFTY